MKDAFCVTIHMVSSLDGIIARPDNSITWFETTSNYEKGIIPTREEMENALKNIDCYIMGSRTYEHALALSENYGWPYGDKPTIVLTHRELPVERENIQFYPGDLTTLVNDELKPRYKNVWLVGGADLAKDFIRLKLADEIRLNIMPILLGGGKLFFDELGMEQPLHLLNVTAFKSGMVELHYEIRG